MAVATYRDLLAWQRATDLAVEVYRVTQQFPKDEIYGLTTQVRRASVSVASNIAEGQGRGAGPEFVHHLRIAQGSLQEAETQLLIAARLGYITTPDLQQATDLSAEVGRLLRGLLKSLV